jgi:predicted Zn-dependent protease
LSLVLSLNFLKAEDPIDPTLSKADQDALQASRNNAYASRMISLGEYEAAMKLVKKALELNPKSQSAQYILTTILVKTEKLEEARESIKVVYPNAEYEQLTFLVQECLDIEIASKNIRTHALTWVLEAEKLRKKPNRWLSYLLASVYFRNNDVVKALEIAKSITEKDPKNVRFNILLGNIYTKMGEYETAATYLAKGMNRDPIFPFCQNHIAFQLITYDDEADNRPEVALSYALLASNATKQSAPDIEDTLGLAYYKTKDILHAKEAQERAVKYLNESLPENQRERSTKLLGFKKQLKKYEDELKKPTK